MNRKRTFRWKNKLSDGSIRQGCIEANSLAHAKAHLLLRGIQPVKVEALSFWHLKHFPKIKTPDVILFFQSLSTFLRAGISLHEALSLFAKQQQKHPRLLALINSIQESVQSGIQLSHALCNYPQYFNALDIEMIKAGEMTGRLDEALSRIVRYRNEQNKLSQLVLRAISYPCLVLSVSTLVIAILLFVVVPQFETLYQNASRTLPQITTLVIFCSRHAIHYGGFYLLAFIFGIYLWRILARKSMRLQSFSEKMLIHIPIIGALTHTIRLTRFSETFSSLLQSGISIDAALKHLSQGSFYLDEKVALEDAQKNLLNGLSIHESFSQNNYFPTLFLEIVAIGEATGRLDQMIKTFSELTQEKAHNQVLMLSTWIEPILILVIGVIVGVLVIAMYLPLFSLGELVG